MRAGVQLARRAWVRSTSSGRQKRELDRDRSRVPETVELDRVFGPFGDRSQSESVGEGDRAAHDGLATTAVSDQRGDEAAVDLQRGDRELEQCG